MVGGVLSRRNACADRSEVWRVDDTGGQVAGDAEIPGYMALLPLVSEPATIRARIEEEKKTWDCLAKVANVQPQ